MDAVLLALAAAAGASALWWHQSRPSRVRAALASAFEADAEVALHVAGHEARTRAQPMSSLHMLYGLVQDDAIITAIREAGHDPEALEDRILAALDATRSELGEQIDYVYGRAVHSAYAAGRKVTCRDLWAYLALSDSAAVLTAADINHTAILFQLCHGGSAPEVTLANNSDVHVVLRNDDYTTREFVCDLLQRVFGFAVTAADATMMQTHTQGRAVVGRFPVAEARTKIREVRELANSHGFPLWIGIEPI